MNFSACEPLRDGAERRRREQQGSDIVRLMTDYLGR